MSIKVLPGELPDEEFLFLAMGRPEFQAMLRPLLPFVPSHRSKPYALRCGCDSHGKRCETEERLHRQLEVARRAWLASGAQPGEARFAEAYQPLLRARGQYAEHFRQFYSPAQDGLWQDHLDLARQKSRA